MKFKIKRRSYLGSTAQPCTAAFLERDKNGGQTWFVEIESLDYLMQLANEENWGGYLILTSRGDELEIPEIQIYDTE